MSELRSRQSAASSDDWEPGDVTTSIPTAGECAARALRSFERLLIAGVVPDAQAQPRVRLDASAFLCAGIALGRKFPREHRALFEASLPFTQLELQLMRDKDFEDSTVLDFLTLRLVRWVSRSPIFIDEAMASCDTFIEQLVPHLDLLRDREHAESLAREIRES